MQWLQMKKLIVSRQLPYSFLKQLQRLEPASNWEVLAIDNIMLESMDGFDMILLQEREKSPYPDHRNVQFLFLVTALDYLNAVKIIDSYVAEWSSHEKA